MRQCAGSVIGSRASSGSVNAMLSMIAVPGPTQYPSNPTPFVANRPMVSASTSGPIDRAEDERIDASSSITELASPAGYNLKVREGSDISPVVGL